MKRKNQWVWLVILALIVIVAGFWLYDWVLGDTEEASGPINATPVALETAAPGARPPPEG